MSEDLFHLGAKIILQNEDQKILLLKGHKNNKDFWDLPGGRLDRNETLEEGLKRELFEEINLKQDLELSHVMMFRTKVRIPIKESDVGLIISVYKASAPVGFTPELSHEHIDLGWFSPSQAAVLLEPRLTVEFLNLLRNLDSSTQSIEA